MSVLLKAFAKGISLSKIKSYLFGSDEVKGSNLFKYLMEFLLTNCIH